MSTFLVLLVNAKTARTITSIKAVLAGTSCTTTHLAKRTVHKRNPVHLHNSLPNHNFFTSEYITVALFTYE